MKRLYSRRWFLLTACILSLLGVVLLLCAWRYRVWSWGDLQAYWGMRSECHPVWKALHFGRIEAGQNVEEVIAQTKPPVIERFGEFVVLSYQDPKDGIHFTGVTVLAKDGKLAGAGAWSCTWQRTFFDQLSEQDQRAFDAAREEFRAKRKVAPKEN